MVNAEHNTTEIGLVLSLQNNTLSKNNGHSAQVGSSQNDSKQMLRKMHRNSNVGMFIAEVQNTTGRSRYSLE